VFVNRFGRNSLINAQNALPDSDLTSTKNIRTFYSKHTDVFGKTSGRFAQNSLMFWAKRPDVFAET
jgi:hypothetical protein